MKMSEALPQVRTLIERPQDFLMVAECPDSGFRRPSPEHPTGMYALPVAIWYVCDDDRDLERAARRAVIKHLPVYLRWITLTPFWCPPLWYVGHATALKAVDGAVAALAGRQEP